jgi:nucleoid-associated protein YgaU
MSRHRLPEQWRWNHATVTVTLAGTGDLALNEDEIRRSVAEYLITHQRPGALAPSITVRIVHQDEAYTSAPRQAPSAEGWRYTLKRGDTLALLSSAFYGTPDYWRQILDANPGLRPEALPVGEVIVIPPYPAGIDKR